MAERSERWYYQTTYGHLRRGPMSQRILALYTCLPSSERYARAISARDCCLAIGYLDRQGQPAVAAYRRTRRQLLADDLLERVPANGYVGFRVVEPPAPPDLLEILDRLDPVHRHVAAGAGRQEALERALRRIPGPVYLLGDVWAPDGPLGALVAPDQAEWWGRLAGRGKGTRGIESTGAPLAGMFTTSAQRLQVAILWTEAEAMKTTKPISTPGGWMWTLLVKNKNKAPSIGPAELADAMAQWADQGEPTLEDLLRGRKRTRKRARKPTHNHKSKPTQKPTRKPVPEQEWDLVIDPEAERVRVERVRTRKRARKQKQEWEAELAEQESVTRPALRAVR